MRMAFMGTPHFSVPVFEAILASGHEVAAVYTRAPSPSGRRNLRLEPSPIHAAADANGLLVQTPRSFKETGEIERFNALRLDVAVVVAYGLILPQAVLNAPMLGCWNLHASLLPRWRGAAPIQRAIWAGDHETGVNLMRMEAGLDSGPVAAVWRTSIGVTETAQELSVRLSIAGADLVRRNLETLASRGLNSLRQPAEEASYARKLDKAEARVIWERDARAISRQINALSPSPGAYTMVRVGGADERVKLIRAELATGSGTPGELLPEGFVVACGDGAVRILEAQRAGRTAVSGRELIAGMRLRIGEILGVERAP